MKNRLHDKKAGIFILVTLIIVSVAEVGFRHMFLRDMISTTANYAETLAVIFVASTILCFTLTGKDRLCYLLYGAWTAYFVFDQIFEFPGTVASFIGWISTQNGLDLAEVGFKSINNLAIVLHFLSMISIISIGALLIEYMNDNSIYNKAFNILCVASILMILGNIAIDIYNFVQLGFLVAMLPIFNNIYRIIMIFLFVFFAYDSAKKQLSKVNFDK